MHTSNARDATTRLLWAEGEGLITWEAIARAALNYMSESDVADMLTARSCWVVKTKEDEA